MSQSGVWVMKSGCSLGSCGRQRGVTLIELMISLVIGTLILAGVTYVFFESRTSYRYNETMSRVQENGRLGLDAIAFDTRMAGFFGCGKPDLIPINVIANTPPVSAVGGGIAVTGYSSDDPEVAFVGESVAGSEVLVIRRGSDRALNLVGNLTTVNANIQVGSNPDNMVAGDVLLVTDCSVGDLFRATTVSSSSGSITTVAHAESTNSSNNLSKTYGPDAQLMRFLDIAFFLRDSGRDTKDGRPIYSLFRRVNGVDEELVDGVADLRFFFALDGDPTQFVSAGAVGDWARVVAVRVHLLASTQEEELTEPQPYRFADDVGDDGMSGGLVMPDDRVMRQEFTQVIALRNRLQ